jgi:hypothetical protein
METSHHEFVVIFPSIHRKGWWRITKVFIRLSPQEVSWKCLHRWSRTVKTMEQANVFAEHVAKCENLEVYTAEDGWKLQNIVRESIREISPEIYNQLWLGDA